MAKRATKGPAFKVGYRKPPVETRFKPGQSGNPRGRPRAESKAVAEASRSVEIIRAVALLEATRSLIDEALARLRAL